MGDIIIDTRARDAVRAFLAETGVDADGASSDEDVQNQIPEFRPPRLGLGAQYVKHASGAGSNVERRLAGALRKERAGREEGEEGDGGEDSSDEEETSRAKSITGRKRERIGDVLSATKKTKKNKNKNKNEQKDEEQGAGSTAVAIVCNDGKDYSVKDGVVCVGGERKSGRVCENGGLGVDGEIKENRDAADAKTVRKTWTSSWKAQKRKKTRSRQKNLKRDKRGAHEKPDYLTEDTLNAGRLRSWQMKNVGKKR